MSNYGLIGKRLDYSFSKAYFENKFQKENIEASYENLELPDLSDLRERVKELDGFNVTIPFKEEILSSLDALDAEAEAIGAVNTVKMEDGKMKGYNSDHYGFATSLKPFLTNMHEKALIIGSGGASKAVIYALEKLGIKCFVLSRSGKGDLTYEDLNANVFNLCKLIVNCSPVGTYPDVEDSPIKDIDGVGEEHLIYDLVYNPEETRLMRDARAKGATAMNGSNMLKLQAEKAWQIWNS